MISMKEISAQNVLDVCELTTNQNGIGTIIEQYLCCNAISIAESKYHSEMNPKAIYNNEVLIGFMMYKRTDDEANTATICRFMIDENNLIAKRLYLSFGFVFTGKIDKNEYYYELKI